MNYLEHFSLQRVKSNAIAQVSYSVQSLERICEYELDERLRGLRSTTETFVNHINKIDGTHSKQTVTVNAALFIPAFTIHCPDSMEVTLTTMLRGPSFRIVR
jgi:hypothetical protein